MPITVDFEQFMAITRDLTGLKMGNEEVEYFDDTPLGATEDQTSHVEEEEYEQVDDFNVDEG